MYPNSDGYALECLEVYNWGTFDKIIYRIEPHRATALLTGKNGSGKSTLVDALLTLLVPNRKRTYNQASGDKRKERDEKTYVRGAYNRLRDSGVQYLRDGSQYSVLLSVFHSPNSPIPFITLAQVFWYTNGTLNKFYVVAETQLSILQHFSAISAINQLRRDLRELGAKVFDQFNDYSSTFRKLLRLQSEKALEIFSQTVSIKEIGSLDYFIREHMLEKTGAENQIQKLRDNFHNLTSAHDAMLKAQRQQSILIPLVQDGDKYDQFNKQIEEIRAAEATIPHYFQYRRKELLLDALKEAEQQFATYETELSQARAHTASLDRDRISLQVNIQSDTTGQHLNKLKEEAVRLQNEFIERKNLANEYSRLVNLLGLKSYTDASSFHANRTQLNEELLHLERNTEELKHHRDKFLIKLEASRIQLQELQADLASLNTQRNQIPRHSLDIRSKITKALRIDEAELPFVGELIRVRDEAHTWKGAIERVLHSFALNMVVPENHYKRVSQFVDKNHLSGKLVYRRIDPKAPLSKMRPNENTLYYKLEVKADSLYADWLRAEIIGTFNYICIENPEDFHHERRAITIAGQIKHDTNRYEKDDRYLISDTTHYILGWDNRAKRQAIEQQYNQLLADAQNLKTEKLRVETKINELSTRRDNLKDLFRFDNFNLLDWQKPKLALDENNARQVELEASSDKLRKLQEQLTILEQEYKDAQQVQEQWNFLKNQCSTRIDTFHRESEKAEAYLLDNPIDSWEAQGKGIHEEFQRYPQALTIDNIAEAREQVRDTINRRANNYQGQRNTIAQSLERQITQFHFEYTVDTEAIGVGLDALPELRLFLHRIQTQDLPRHQSRFKDMLNKKVLDNIESFQTELESQVEDYRKVIEQLNTALIQIPYEDSAYIQLQAEPTGDPAINDFRNELRACFDEAFIGTFDANERAYGRVKVLIERFEKNETWTRKVIDVRNWLNFAAIELWRSDHTQKRYHSDSSGMSGGQKAKLAYTILASAVAYQYGTGLGEKPEQTFRFVVIDEAFSKVDDNNARFAMSLFAQLGLQLLVVTPLDKLHVVEPFVGAYHLVINNEEGNDSRLINLTVEDFQERRREILGEQKNWAEE
jgi:uncharacterized protein YPO0396